MRSESNEKLSEAELCPPELLENQEILYLKDVRELLLSRIDEYTNVPCPACNSAANSPIFCKYNFDFVRCVDCRTIFMNPRPTPSILADYYQNAKSYEFWAKSIFPASETVRRDKIHQPWFEKIMNYCRDHRIPTDTIVEVGAGFGTFCEIAQTSGLFERVIAVEPTPSLAAHCRNRNLETLELCVEALKPNCFTADVIVSFEVIEHVFSPTQFVKQLKSCLRPGGLLVLSCPNGEGFDIATLGAESLAVDAEHITLFNPNSLTLMLERLGFAVLDVSTPGRLDAEFVRQAALEERINLSQQPFLKRLLLDEWDRLGWSFQTFLAENCLSSHMWTVARLSDE
jgi:2-polyprenyl-3-methyl-5-hydroxy-6-metoxy-1,4-benzoquinol methylase